MSYLQKRLNQIIKNVNNDVYSAGEYLSINLGMGTGWCAGTVASVMSGALADECVCQLLRAPHNKLSLSASIGVLVGTAVILSSYNYFTKLGKSVGVVAADTLIRPRVSLENLLAKNRTTQ